MSQLSEMNPNFVGCNCGVQVVPLVSNTSDGGQTPIFSVCKKRTLSFEPGNTSQKSYTSSSHHSEWSKCQQRSDRRRSCYLTASKTLTCFDQEESQTAFQRRWPTVLISEGYSQCFTGTKICVNNLPCYFWSFTASTGIKNATFWVA